MLAALSLAAAGAARAQEVCDGRPIVDIRVETSSVFFPDDSALVGFVRAWANTIHGRTRRGVVRRELLVRVGDPCDRARLAESERVLRALPYIREAGIAAIPSNDGVRLLVRTRDEWSLSTSVRVEGGHGFPLRRFRIADENFLGRGVRTQLRYDGLRRRPAYDLEVTTRQLFKRLDGTIIAGRSSVGLIGEQRLMRPFETEFDRWAWRQSARYRKEPFVFFSPVFGQVDQPVVALSADLGAAVRVGSPGRLLLAGAALSGERLYAEGAPMAAVPGDDSAAAAAFDGRFGERRRVRAYLFAGARALRFRSHYGVDAVHGLEDVREGIEAGVVVGKSLFGGLDLQHDWFAAAELYYGAEYEHQLAFVRGKLEGRYLLAEREWDGVLLDGQFLVYNNVDQRGVFLFGGSVAGGWHVRTPFQLTLGGLNGMRGYGYGSLPVGRRIVLHGEHRYFLGTLFGAIDLGTAAFLDVGRGWAGDAAFGADTGVRAAIGVGMRAGAPRGSRRTYRIDLAMPLGRGEGLQLQVALRQQFGIFRGEPDDLARSREQVSSTTIFNFPRF